MRVLVALVAALAVTGCAEERPRTVDDCLGIHGCGVLDPASPDFHGRELERTGWDLALCASCHGASFAGTSAAPTCRTCHADGPDACSTCHGATGPTTGAHRRHADAAVACSECHAVPSAWSDEGHVRRGGGGDPPPAEVAMTGLATATPRAGDRTAAPSFDPSTGTCAQVYCHGDVLGGAGGVEAQPRWVAVGPGPAACDRCHGAPPPDHAWTSCATCHPSGRHLDGAIDVGVTGAGCTGCHGGATAAPPRALDGSVFSTALPVGAHTAHVEGTHRLTAPLACTACHAMPTSVTAPGHLDTPAPAEVNAALGWDRDLASCATAWCHGPARPTWTRTGEVACGTCHGVPPATPAHDAGMTLTSCASCHGGTVDGFGNILITDGPTGPVSRHIDGVVDAP